MSATAHRRILRLQRHILKTIRADVRKVLGPQTPTIRRYYEAYKREFRGHAHRSSKEELLKDCLHADFILLGDYHTFAQSQRTALRLLRELADWETPLVLALEMVPSACQHALNSFLSEEITEEEFLEKMDYRANWGFPWESFRELLLFAREHNIRVLALNLDSGKLEVRDAHAAQILSEYTRIHPKQKIFVLYGDLHLARGHIPRYLKAALKERALKRRTLTIFQNSESLYWRLASQRAAHSVDVMRLGKDRYCIMSAAPWVKLQSYLEWAEAAAPIDDGADPNVLEVAHDRLKILAETLGLELGEKGLEFSVHTVDDLSFLARLEGLTRDEVKSVKYHVLLNRNVFVSDTNVMYLASTSVNSLSEGVGLAAFSTLSGTRTVFHDADEHFFAAVLASTLSYFGSKILNHKRKCDLEDDYKMQLERPIARTAMPQERAQRRVAKLVLSHCRAQREALRGRPYRAPHSVRGPSRMPVFLETARRLGAILGEKLYASYVDGHYTSNKITQLFSTPLTSTKQARRIYLDLVADLERAPLTHTSKLDLF